MAEIKAFGALRYTDKAGEIFNNVCPPYDIIDENQRLAFLAKSKNNVVRLELPKGEEPYTEAARALAEMEESGVLAKDKKPGIYIYEEEFSAYGERKKIKGIYARVKLCDFSQGVVLPHEETLSKAKKDRFELMSSTYCNFSAIYSMYTDEEKIIRAKTDLLSERKPDVEFVDYDGIVQRLWVIDDEAETAFFEKAFANKKLYIADGHHRYETALNFRNKLIDDGIVTDENHPANYCLMFLADIDHEGLAVFPTHRMLKNLNNFNSENALLQAEQYFEIKKTGCPKCLEKELAANSDKNAFGYYDGANAYLLVLKNNAQTAKALDEMLGGKSEAFKSLDVAVLHSLILEKIFGIDKENMANQINLNYTRDYGEAIEKVESGDYNCCFLLNPTKVRQIKDVATAGEKMPQKSTYFYPKLITGLVMNELMPIEK